MTPSGKSAVAVIPARGGSKGLPGKNVMPMLGHPLIAWTIAAARTTGLFDAIVVSTDSDEIAAAAHRYGALTCRRPPELATDTSLVKDAVRHCVGRLEAQFGTPDYLFLLQPTSPLREPNDIADCLAAFEANAADSATTFRPAEEPIEWAYRIDAGVPEPAVKGVKNWLSRQMLPDYYYLNGAVYIVSTMPFLANPSQSFLFGRQAASIMPGERSLDVDNAFQFRIAEMMLAERKPVDPGGYLTEAAADRLFDF